MKIAQQLPASYEKVSATDKCASFDGDADRLIYFRRSEESKSEVNLLDGDKIAVLITKYIKEVSGEKTTHSFYLATRRRFPNGQAHFGNCANSLCQRCIHTVH